MATIFSKRVIAESFIYRNVVMSSLAGISVKRVLMINQHFDFGTMGKWSNTTSVDLDINKLQEVNNLVKAHQDNILEQINVLEEFIRWVKLGYHGQFQEVLMQEKPLLFNGLMRGKTLVLQIFGEGLLDMELRCDFKNARGTATLIERVEELLQAFRNHLDDLAGISLDRLVKKV